MRTEAGRSGPDGRHRDARGARWCGNARTDAEALAASEGVMGARALSVGRVLHANNHHARVARVAARVGGGNVSTGDVDVEYLPLFGQTGGRGNRPRSDRDALGHRTATDHRRGGGRPGHDGRRRSEHPRRKPELQRRVVARGRAVPLRRGMREAVGAAGAAATAAGDLTTILRRDVLSKWGDTRAM